MAVLFSLSLHHPLLPFRPRCVLSSKHRAFFRVLPLGGLRISAAVLVRSSRNAVPGTEQEVLQAVTDSDEKCLPCVRTFENDSARLTLVGAVDLQQALTAAAADEHIESGIPAMVVETVFPGSADEHSTVSTRLFLPARKVKRKGRPGTERSMKDLEKPREQVSASFTLSSSDERIISVLAEAVCISALQSTERSFLVNYLGRSSSSLFLWLQKPGRIVSKDSSVIITKLFEDEIVENAKSLLGEFNAMKAHFRPLRNNLKYHWWMPSAHSKLEKIGGPQFSARTSEYIPAYRIQIDANRVQDVKFEGWRKSSDDKWEILLTHSQMVGLADVIDMYYEDLYTLPRKELSCGVVGNFTNLPNKKRSSVLLKMLSVTVASGIFIIAISTLGQLCLPHLKIGSYNRESLSLPSAEVESLPHQSLNDDELEAFCVSVVQRIKDSFGWPGDIVRERDMGVWTGKLPEYMRMVVENDSNGEGISTTTENIGAEIKTSVLDIASYQVVLSLDGKLVGFQPTSRVAINQWAGNPLAKELYGGRNLSPGLIEPGLKVQPPDGGVVVLELLMSIKPDACFALARPG